MRVLIIREGPSAPPTISYLREKLHGDEVVENRVPEEGIAVYDCKNVEKLRNELALWKPDLVINVGTCLVGNFHVSETIDKNNADPKILELVGQVVATEDTTEGMGD